MKERDQHAGLPSGTVKFYVWSLLVFLHWSLGERSFKIEQKGLELGDQIERRERVSA